MSSHALFSWCSTYIIDNLQDLTMAHRAHADIIHRGLHMINPLGKFCLPPKVTRRKTSLLRRIRLGVVFTHCYAHLINQSNSPDCEHCQTPETAEHILCDCPAYMLERRTLENSPASIGRQPLCQRTPFSAHVLTLQLQRGQLKRG